MIFVRSLPVTPKFLIHLSFKVLNLELHSYTMEVASLYGSLNSADVEQFRTDRAIKNS